jgi:hypothetical protein
MDASGIVMQYAVMHGAVVSCKLQRPASLWGVRSNVCMFAHPRLPSIGKNAVVDSHRFNDPILFLVRYIPSAANLAYG